MRSTPTRRTAGARVRRRLAGPVLAGLCALAAPAAAQEAVSSAPGATLRAIDKITGETVDIEIGRGETRPYGRLRILLGDCRFPTDDPSSDAFALLEIRDIGRDAPVFEGWMVASSPALNALDHARYDVWVLRCNRP